MLADAPPGRSSSRSSARLRADGRVAGERPRRQGAVGEVFEVGSDRRRESGVAARTWPGRVRARDAGRDAGGGDGVGLASTGRAAGPASEPNPSRRPRATRPERRVDRPREPRARRRVRAIPSRAGKCRRRRRVAGTQPFAAGDVAGLTGPRVRGRWRSRSRSRTRFGSSVFVRVRRALGRCGAASIGLESARRPAGLARGVAPGSGGRMGSRGRSGSPPRERMAARPPRRRAAARMARASPRSRPRRRIRLEAGWRTHGRRLVRRSGGKSAGCGPAGGAGGRPRGRAASPGPAAAAGWLVFEVAGAAFGSRSLRSGFGVAACRCWTAVPSPIREARTGRAGRSRSRLVRLGGRSGSKGSSSSRAQLRFRELSSTNGSGSRRVVVAQPGEVLAAGSSASRSRGPVARVSGRDGVTGSAGARGRAR